MVAGCGTGGGITLKAGSPGKRPRIASNSHAKASKSRYYNIYTQYNDQYLDRSSAFVEFGYILYNNIIKGHRNHGPKNKHTQRLIKCTNMSYIVSLIIEQSLFHNIQ